ncbi:MAG TPA: hypothetical protein VNA25_01290 [Phycisphaerae bacterium]|nr:hypothetical protein [Phycisphaerae bacterium]
MRIASIELAGSIKEGEKLPRAFAKITRTSDSEFIEVTVIPATGLNRKHMVRADCEEDLWSMAECLLDSLEGRTGPNSDIHDYFRELQRFAD